MPSPAIAKAYKLASQYHAADGAGRREMNERIDEMPTPASYFPPARGVYEVAAGLSKFGKDLGAGEADSNVFQIDRMCDAYLNGKRAARRESLTKYYQRHRLRPGVSHRVVDFIVRRLTSEWPRWFAMDGNTLACALTGERLTFGEGMWLERVERTGAPEYVDALDALASQVQEDLAIVSSDGSGHRTSAIHLCFPNHWAAEEKIGKAFAEVHEPVAGMKGMNRKGDEMVSMMVNATEGLVRFAWGVTWDGLLNHHPDRMTRKRFDPSEPAAFLRVERQTIWGFPEVGASLFTIRTYLYDCAELSREHRRRLASAVRSMSDASLRYKGLAESKEALVDWLERPG